MVPEEDKVPLVVECDHPPAPELWVMWEEGCKHASNRVAQASGQIVQNNLRDVTGWPPMALHTQEGMLECSYAHAHSISMQCKDHQGMQPQHSKLSVQIHIAL